MKNLIYFILILSFSSFSQKDTLQYHTTVNQFADFTEVIEKAGACNSPDGTMLTINDYPPNYQYLEDNGYCFAGIPTTNEVTMCFSFVATATNTFLNLGFSESCVNNSFGPFTLWNSTCTTVITTGLNPTNLVIGNTYIWCVTMKAWGGGSCNGYTTICPYFIPNSSLPVELTEFNGDCNNIHWETASENNSDYFLLKKSTDGTIWVDVIKVPAAGNSTQFQHYSVPLQPLFILQYYKLLQYDLNGEFKEYTPISIVCSYYEQKIVAVYDVTGRYIADSLLLLTDGIYIIEYENCTHRKIYHSN